MPFLIQYQPSDICETIYEGLLEALNVINSGNSGSADPSHIDMLNGHFEIHHKDGGVFFRINGLYHYFLDKRCIDDHALGYRQFRQLLYSSHLNARLSTQGYVVAVPDEVGGYEVERHEAEGDAAAENEAMPSNKVDNSWYHLRVLDGCDVDS